RRAPLSHRGERGVHAARPAARRGRRAVPAGGRRRPAPGAVGRGRALLSHAVDARRAHPGDHGRRPPRQRRRRAVRARAGVADALAGRRARGRAWVAIVRRAAPAAAAGSAPLVTAWMVGAGASGVLPSRAGDGVRLVLARRHVPGAGYPLLAGTLVAETA